MHPWSDWTSGRVDEWTTTRINKQKKGTKERLHLSLTHGDHCKPLTDFRALQCNDRENGA